MRRVRQAGTCPHCKQKRKLWAKGLCQKCYLAHGDKYPALPRGNQNTATAEESDEASKMPVRVFAVVKQIQSPLSGRLPQLVDWFRKRSDAFRFAAANNQEATLRVYEWYGGGHWTQGIGRQMRQRLLRRFRRRDKRVGRGPSRSLKRKRSVLLDHVAILEEKIAAIEREQKGASGG